MNRQIIMLLAIAVGVLSDGAYAQSTDAAAERARIANQRIAAEAARRTAVDVEPETSASTGDDPESAAPVDDPEPAAPPAAVTPAPATAPAPAPVATVSSTRVSSSRPAPPRPPAEMEASSAPVVAASPEPEATVSSTRVSSSRPAPPRPPAAVEATSAPVVAASPEPEAAPEVIPQEVEPAPTPAMSDVLNELERLGQLRDAGYVTDEEFERIKARILEGQL